MKETLIQLITATLGSLGFALIFGLQRKHLPFAALGGMISWSIYLGVHSMTEGVFLANLCAAVFAVTYAELLAHLRRCPATLFVVPAIIPLVPGSSLYYAMDSAVHGDLTAAGVYGHRTLVAALAIAAGISFVTVCRELRTPKRAK